MSRPQRVVVALLLLTLVVVLTRGLGDFLRGAQDEPPVRPIDPTRPRKAAPTPTPPFRLPGRDQGVVGLFVQPDDGRIPILDELAAAETSIDLEVYLLTDPGIIEALESAVQRGIEVRVILEEHPYGGAGEQSSVFERLQRAGVDVRWNNPTFRFTHIKTFVVDRQTAVVMNLNLTRSAFSRNREFGVVTTRPTEVAQAAAIFDADWRRAAEPAGGPLIVSPTTSRQQLLGLIDEATTSIDIYAEVVRDQQVVDALIDAAHRGVRVRLIMSADPDGGDDGADDRAELARGGIEVRLARGGLYIHAKMMLIDGARAFVGSQNFTATSLDLNRELGIILTDRPSLTRLASIFDRDFSQGQEVPSA